MGMQLIFFIGVVSLATAWRMLNGTIPRVARESNWIYPYGAVTFIILVVGVTFTFGSATVILHSLT